GCTGSSRASELEATGGVTKLGTPPVVVVAVVLPPLVVVLFPGRGTTTVVVREAVVNVRKVVSFPNEPPGAVTLEVGTTPVPGTSVLGVPAPGALVSGTPVSVGLTSVTGQTVVLITTTLVTVRPGQSTTVDSHEVMVDVTVEKMVD